MIEYCIYIYLPCIDKDMVDVDYMYFSLIVYCACIS